ncbi:hypothetical protein C5B97_04745 [Pseudoclavibacter sp. RFBB5]|nr:hypothetical protein C5B97_04745 [Pseudoclavibacter sp. RFBB5]
MTGQPGEGEPDETHRLALTQLDEPEVGDVVGGSAADLASQVSTTVTLDAIEENGGRLVMIHGTGVALDDGRAIAFVGPSGRGKTTLAKMLGREYGYVTDETLANDFDGNVPPYRKPLSVALDPSRPKEHLSPRKRRVRPSLDAREMVQVALDGLIDANLVERVQPVVVGNTDDK